MSESLNKKEYILNLLKEPILYIIIFCIFIQVQIYNTIPEYVITNDTSTYVQDFQGSIRSGKLDSRRTPVYPYIVKIIKKIGGDENLYKNIVIFQKILFIITLILFYFTIKLVTKNKIISTIISIIFGICPYIIFWNIMILTEAVSLFEIVLLSFLTIKYLKKPNNVIAGCIGILILAMIMTRPQYIYLLPIYILFWILKFVFDRKDEKKQIIIGIISCLICGIILLIYCSIMKYQHGEFSITAVSYINNTVTAIDSDLYKRAENKEMVKIVDETISGKSRGSASWEALNILTGKYSVNEIKQFANQSLKKDSKYFEYMFNKTLNLEESSIGTVGYVNVKEQFSKINYNNLACLLLPINFAFVYIMVIVGIAYLLWKLIKFKKIDWIVAFFTLLIFANLFTLIVGAPYESQRLFLPSIVSVLLMLGLIISKIKTTEIAEGEKKVKTNKDNTWLYKLFIEKTNDTKIQFFRYLFVGGFAAIVNIGSLYVFKEFLNIYYLVANVLGFVLGLITNYLLSKLLVFAKEKKMNGIIEFTTYAIIGVVGLGLDTFFIWIFTEKFKLYYMISKIISTALVFIWNFFGRKALYIVADKIIKDK